MLDVSAPHLVYFMRPERALVINRAYMDADRHRFPRIPIGSMPRLNGH